MPDNEAQAHSPHEEPADRAGHPARGVRRRPRSCCAADGDWLLLVAAVCLPVGRLLPSMLTALFATGLLLVAAVVTSLRRAARRLETIQREENSLPPASGNSP